MAIQRLRRGAQVERNRGLLLAAARRVFLARGFHGATLEAIAEEAGFSKGVVYSQFESKADLFLALLAERIAERAEQNERIVREAASGAAGLAALVAAGERLAAAEPEWALLVLEFRAHAARDAALNARYAAAHARTTERLTAALSKLLPDTGPDWPPDRIAAVLLALGSGATLENCARPGALPPGALADLLERALGASESRTS
jgi:AcrR family transcriptional regulator